MSEKGRAPRQREYRPRTRTGCITCKIRRVKCDEAKPSCLRCTSTGRKCDGYAAAFDRCSPTSSVSSPTSLVASPTGLFPGNDREHRSFQFFIARTAPELSGFFKTEFWNRLLLQAAHHEPSLRHAIIALGSLHERFEAGDTSVLRSNQDVSEGGFALQQYNLAIRHLVKPSTEANQSVDVCLTGCVLFTCFETLRGHYSSAFTHVHSGLKILRDLQQKDAGSSLPYSTLACPSNPYIPLNSLNMLFTRLDTQVIQMIGVSPESSWQLHPIVYGKMKLEMPPSFPSLEAARDAMDLYWNACAHALWAVENPADPMDPADPTTQAYISEIHLSYSTKLQEWFTAFQAFLATSKHAFDPPKLRGALLLKLLHRLAAFHLELMKLPRPFDETEWDTFNPYFFEFLSLATSIINADAEFHSSTKRSRTFNIDSGVVAPLFQVATKCRDPYVRRRAIALLYSAGRQEGVWNGPIVARVCQRVMEIEEEGLGEVRDCKDVPDWARLSGVEPVFNMEGRRVSLTYMREPMGKEGRKPRTEAIEW